MRIRQHNIISSLTLAPPWGTIPAWQEANRSIDFHFNCHYPKLQQAMQIAGATRSRLESIFASLDELARMTCPRCPDVCCLSASPWYDMRDLIFLHLNRLAIPRTQTIQTAGEICCYLSHRGCTLPRIIRPWICIWYLCPVQTANLKDRNPGQWQRLTGVFGKIKAQRKELEDVFICVIRNTQ